MVQKKMERGLELRNYSSASLLRCKELGLSMEELNEITEGMVLDLLAERSNDEWYRKNDTVYKANQEDFDRF